MHCVVPLMCDRSNIPFLSYPQVCSRQLQWEWWYAWYRQRSWSKISVWQTGPTCLAAACWGVPPAASHDDSEWKDEENLDMTSMHRALKIVNDTQLQQTFPLIPLNIGKKIAVLQQWHKDTLCRTWSSSPAVPRLQIKCQGGAYSLVFHCCRQ